MAWTPQQRNVTIAAYLGWTLDAFDFFLMVFILKDIAAEFNTNIPTVAFGITLTLMMRPVGALIFGWLADKFGRRPTLMVNIACYSLLELLSGFSPNLTTLLVLRALFGIAMGGEWGVGGALTMETVPPKSRGIVSGLLQAGYPSGYLLASIVFGLLVSIHRLARHVLRRRAACAAGALRARARAGIAGLQDAGKASSARVSSPR